MTLKQYLSEQGITYETFAARIGVATATVIWRYANGRRMPRPHIMRRITEATDGAVQPSDFYEMDDGAAA